MQRSQIGYSVVFSFCLLSVFCGCDTTGIIEIGNSKGIGKAQARVLASTTFSDVCAEYNYYGDGQCDQFCQEPDPDCDQGTTLSDSCEGLCGSTEPAAAGCYCDAACDQNGDCCIDFRWFCEEEEQEEQEENQQETGCVADGTPCLYCHDNQQCSEGWQGDGECDCACANFQDTEDCNGGGEEQEQQQETECVADGNPCAYCHHDQECTESWQGDGECDCACANFTDTQDCQGSEEQGTDCVADGNPCLYCHNNQQCSEGWQGDGECDCGCTNFEDTEDCQLDCSNVFFTMSSCFQRHDAIEINGDDDFVSENGVRNPNASGTEQDPYLISRWIIDYSYSGVAIHIRNTSRCFKIDKGQLKEVKVGILLEQVTCATVSGTKIEDLEGEGDGDVAVGIDVKSSSNVTLSGNQIEDVSGGDGSSGSFGWPGGFLAGGQGGEGDHGGDAIGIHASGSSRLTLSNNQVTSIKGGSGGLGGPGGQGEPGGAGGTGGNGGKGIGLWLEECSDFTIQGETLSDLYGGSGGAGNAGGYCGAAGGVGGRGGDALGILFTVAGSYSSLQEIRDNQIHTLYGGAGASGGAGAWGGWSAVKGGDGGSGGGTGNALGVVSSSAQNVVIQGNNIRDLWGGAGPAGGAGGKGAGMDLTPTEGGKGASGRAGGAAVGLLFQNASDVQVQDNTFSNLRGGAGAVGSAGGYAGADAGHGGNGGWGAAGMFKESNGVATGGNTIDSLEGGTGGWGAAGAAGVAFGGVGGNGGEGGSAIGFYFETCSGIQSSSDSCSGLSGNNGGTGGMGGAYNLLTSQAKGGDGGDGGDGGCLVFTQSPDRSVSGVSAYGCTAGSGGMGNMASGKNGQDGSSGEIIQK